MLRINKTIFEYGFLVILFCFSIALFNLPGYIFAALILLMFMLYSRNIQLTANELLLMFFSLFYFVFYWLHYGMDINTIILYLLGPWSAYILGKVYMKTSVNDNSFVVFIFVLAIGMYLHGVLNVIAYIRSDYFDLYNYYRQSVDFWRGELVNVKTTEMLYTFATGACLGVIFASYKIWHKILSALVIAVSLLLTVFLANRSLLVIFIVLFAWRMIVWMADSSVIVKRKIIASIIIVAILALAVIFISLNIAGVGDAFFATKIVQRFISDSELTRFDVWNIFFDDFMFLEHPFGGEHLTNNTEHGYLHNMWLDVYNRVGSIPFILLVVITVKNAVHCFTFCRTMTVNNRKKESIVFESLMIAIFLNLMVEPIIEANPYYFLIVLMFLGAMEGYRHKVLFKEGGSLEKNYSF